VRHVLHAAISPIADVHHGCRLAPGRHVVVRHSCSEEQSVRVLESFPASDPPSGTLGVNEPARADVIDVSRPSSPEPLWKSLAEWLEVGILVPLVVLALIALAIPVVLVVMSVINVLSWAVGRVW
jgi:hypothetical protein